MRFHVSVIPSRGWQRPLLHSRSTTSRKAGKVLAVSVFPPFPFLGSSCERRMIYRGVLAAFFVSSVQIPSHYRPKSALASNPASQQELVTPALLTLFKDRSLAPPLPLVLSRGLDRVRSMPPCARYTFPVSWRRIEAIPSRRCFCCISFFPGGKSVLFVRV